LAFATAIVHVSLRTEFSAAQPSWLDAGRRTFRPLCVGGDGAGAVPTTVKIKNSVRLDGNYMATIAEEGYIPKYIYAQPP
jgi:hypothetical protein